MKEEDQGKENQGTSYCVPDNLSVKRKRGRPRKDRSRVPGQQSATPTATPVAATSGAEQEDQKPKIVTDTKPNLLGQTVFGVLDGSFEAGYLLTVRVGNTDTTLKGIVFLPGATVPISESNDVAPHTKMVERSEVHTRKLYQANHMPVSPKVEAFHPQKASPRVTRSSLASQSQPQTAKGVQNVNQGTPITPSDVKVKAASHTATSGSQHDEKVKPGTLPGTVSAYLSEAQGDGYSIKNENQAVQNDKPASAALAHKEPKTEQSTEPRMRMWI